MNEIALEKFSNIFSMSDWFYNLMFLGLMIMLMIFVVLINYKIYLCGFFSKSLTIIFTVLDILLFIVLIIVYLFFC